MGGGDPSAMQSMMSQPNLQNLMKNPDMINNALKMLKDPSNKGMLDMVKQQNPNLNLDMMLKSIKVLSKVVEYTNKVRRAWSNVFVKLAFFAILVAFIAYFFG